VISLIFFLTGRTDIATVSLALAVFNLLPVTMLDGGHIISAFFPDSKLHKALSLVCSIALLGIGIFVALYTKENFTIMIVALYLLIGVISEK
jgi:Zn-dependent protease